MTYSKEYSTSRPASALHAAYLDNLASVSKWLLARKRDVRLLIGDRADVPTAQKFKELLRNESRVIDRGHTIDEPILSVQDLLSQISATDVVVATRFHNIILALLCEKPVIAISFHQKCESLMSAMDLSAYCLDMNDLKANTLIEKLSDIEFNAAELKLAIRERVGRFRSALNEQYRVIFDDVLLGGRSRP